MLAVGVVPAARAAPHLLGLRRSARSRVLARPGRDHARAGARLAASWRDGTGLSIAPSRPAAVAGAAAARWPSSAWTALPVVAIRRRVRIDATPRSAAGAAALSFPPALLVQTFLDEVWHRHMLRFAMHLSFAVLWLGLLVALWRQRRQIPVEYAIFATGVVLLPFFAGTVLSAGRLGMMGFPLFWSLAILGRREGVDTAVKILFPPLMAALMFVAYALPDVHALSTLGDRLRARIAAEGAITFAAFMEAALYDADDGFYARGPRIGRGGAFATVPTLVPLFTAALAAELRGALGVARATVAVHRGRGRAGGRDACGRVGVGALRSAGRARAVRALGGACGAAAGAAAGGAARLARGARAGDGRDRRERGARRVPGARVALAGRAAVAVDEDGRFVWTRADSTPEELRAIVERSGAAPPSGLELQVSPAQSTLQAQLAAQLERGARCTSSTTARQGPSATCARFRGCARISGADREAIRCRHQVRRTSRWTSTSARCARRARPRACARCWTSPSRTGCAGTARSKGADAARRRARSGSGSKRSRDEDGAGASFRVLVQERL